MCTYPHLAGRRGRVPSADEDARAVLPGGGGVGADDGEDHGRGLLSNLGDAEGAGGLVGASVGELHEAVGVELVGVGGLGGAVRRRLGVADDDGVERGGDGGELGGARVDGGAVGAGRADHFEGVVGLGLGDLVAVDALCGGDEGVEDARAGGVEGCTLFVERVHGDGEEVGEVLLVAVGAVPVGFVVPRGLELVFGDGFDAGAGDGALGGLGEVGGAVVGVGGELEPDGEGGEDETEGRDGDCGEAVSRHGPVVLVAAASADDTTVLQTRLITLVGRYVLMKCTGHARARTLLSNTTQHALRTPPWWRA